MAAIVIENTTKTYGMQKAVDDLSLEVPKGSIYGFIGPNGSGKSTTLRMIMRMIMPDQGRIEVLGSESREAANDRIGYLPEERGLYKKMKVVDVLAYHAKLKGMTNPKADVHSWLERLKIADAAPKKVEALSKGMAQKIQFIATVIAHPELIILDEPFTGLDPVNRVVVRDVIIELRRGGTTVIFSTHDMNVAEEMCDYIFMIFRGKKVLDGTLTAIRNQYATDTIRLRTSDHVNPRELQELPGVNNVVEHGNVFDLVLNRDGDSQAILRQLSNRHRIEQFVVGKPSLHDIFVRNANPDSELEDRE
jgi:ABC-2 type transport system ATP-binding protein